MCYITSYMLSILFFNQHMYGLFLSLPPSCYYVLFGIYLCVSLSFFLWLTELCDVHIFFVGISRMELLLGLEKILMFFVFISSLKQYNQVKDMEDIPHMIADIPWEIPKMSKPTGTNTIFFCYKLLWGYMSCFSREGLYVLLILLSCWFISVIRYWNQSIDQIYFVSASNADDGDEKLKATLVQQKGRFKVTSENLDFDKVITRHDLPPFSLQFCFSYYEYSLLVGSTNTRPP